MSVIFRDDILKNYYVDCVYNCHSKLVSMLCLILSDTVTFLRFGIFIFSFSV